MQKIKLEKINRKDGTKEIIEIYDSFSPSRLENESREEYLNRRLFMKEMEISRKRKKNMIHISSQLIPKVNEKGKIEIIDGKVMWVGVTKGVTYTKQTNE